MLWLYVVIWCYLLRQLPYWNLDILIVFVLNLIYSGFFTYHFGRRGWEVSWCRTESRCSSRIVSWRWDISMVTNREQIQYKRKILLWIDPKTTIHLISLARPTPSCPSPPVRRKRVTCCSDKIHYTEKYTKRDSDSNTDQWWGLWAGRCQNNLRLRHLRTTWHHIMMGCTRTCSQHASATALPASSSPYKQKSCQFFLQIIMWSFELENSQNKDTLNVNPMSDELLTASCWPSLNIVLPLQLYSRPPFLILWPSNTIRYPWRTCSFTVNECKIIQ